MLWSRDSFSNPRDAFYLLHMVFQLSLLGSSAPIVPGGQLLGSRTGPEDCNYKQNER